MFSVGGNEAAAIAAAQRAMGHSRTLGDGAGAAKALSYVSDSYVMGSTPVASALAELDGELEGTRVNASAFYMTAGSLAALRAMVGEFEVAGSLLEERERVARERGASRDLSNKAVDAVVSLLREDPRAAVDAVATEYEARRDRGDRVTTTFHGFGLAEGLLLLGDLDSARDVIRELQDIVVPDNRGDRVELLLLEARLDAATASSTSAAAKATQAIELLAPTDWLDLRARAWEVLGHAQFGLTALEAAVQAFTTSAELFKRKGNLVGRARVEATLDRITAE
jgi:hypothetical protein